MKLKNLIYSEKGKISYLDLKMGTNCVLREPDDPSYQNFYMRDCITTTQKYGFRVTGFTLFNKQDEV
jgi:hypothetical protein